MARLRYLLENLLDIYFTQQSKQIFEEIKDVLFFEVWNHKARF